MTVPCPTCGHPLIFTFRHHDKKNNEAVYRGACNNQHCQHSSSQCTPDFESGPITNVDDLMKGITIP